MAPRCGFAITLLHKYRRLWRTRTGYAVSQARRERIEECFGWMKAVGLMRKTRHRGRALVEWFFVLTAAAYNLIRIPKLLAAMG